MARLFIFTKPDSINRPGTKDNLHIVPLKYKRKILRKKERKHAFEKKTWPRKRKREQDLGQEKRKKTRSRLRKKANFKIFLFLL